MMKNQIAKRGVLLFLLGLTFTMLYGQEMGYKVPLIYLPDMVRRDLNLNKEQLPQGYQGFIPEYDGQPFQLNRKTTSEIKESAAARKEIDRVFKQIRLDFDINNLVPEQEVRTQGMRNNELMKEYQQPYEEEFQDQLNRKLGKLAPQTTEEVRKNGEDMNRKARNATQVFPFRQRFEDVFLENTRIAYVVRPNGLNSINGNVFSIVKVTNQRRLNAEEAVKSAREHVARHSVAKSARQEKEALVLLPYAEGFRYAWKVEVTAEDGPYMLWIDAENGKVLQLLPQFYYNSAQGLTFNPDPTAGTLLLRFEVDPPSGGKYYLTKAGALTVTANGADGCSGNVSINDDGSGFANFNVSPLNGTVVERTSMTGYNCRFQEINTYGQIFWQLELYKLFGALPLCAINVTVNNSGDGGFASGCNITLNIGTSTTGSSTVCSSSTRHNAAIDNTIGAHELGHIVNGAHYGGVLHGSVNEGLADFWACTIYNLDVVGRWYGKNCATPTEGGGLPRQATPNDIFPEHRVTGSGSREIHSDGQMVNWAMWNMRREYLEASALGAIATNIELLQSLPAAGFGIVNGITDQRVHDAFVDLDRQLVANSGTSRYTHKILSGFARAGIFLSDREAIIDIDDDYLNRNLATTPVFTVWTGRDFTFDGAGNAVTTGTLPFNTTFEIDVANDAAFTVNHFSSGALGGVTAGAGGSASWTMPAATWNALKSGGKLYYRVTTRSASGGNIRTSAKTGDGTVGTDEEPIETPYAVINESGECECSTSSTSGAESGPLTYLGAIFLIPVVLGLVRRRQLRKRT